jgi:phosphoribosylaminoimidazole-succinocarboxamide synthase
VEHGERLKLIRKGKVKEVYEVDRDTLEFVFTDQISVFDKIIPVSIPHKGETLCRESAFWFQIAKEMGIRTHFRELVASNRMRVARVDVIADYSKINSATRNYLIPLEFVVRYYVAGSLMDRISSGILKPEDLGFRPGHVVGYGEKLDEPYFELTTKLEKVDRHLSFDEAMRISGLREDEMEEIRKTILRIDEKIQQEVDERNLIHVDGKKEFAFDKDRRLMVVDTFGTADEDRWWDAEAYSNGNVVELSKEFVRQYYRQTGYYSRLEQARKSGQPEPDIPPLPPDLVQRTSDLYIEIFERITGESFD